MEYKSIIVLEGSRGMWKYIKRNSGENRIRFSTLPLFSRETSFPCGVGFPHLGSYLR